jgi:hypothetical protein
MNSANLLKPLEACDSLEAMAFLFFNKAHLSKLVQAGANDLSVCHWIVEFCNNIAHLKDTSVIVDILLNEMLDSKLVSHLLQQLQDIGGQPDTVKPNQITESFLIFLSGLTGLVSEQDTRKGILN